MIVVLLPLLSSFLCFFSKRFFATFYSMTAVGCAMLFAIAEYLSFDHPYTSDLYSWVSIYNLHINFGVYINKLTTIMLCIVTIVSFVVHAYSCSYMKKDPNFPRFMSYLSFFTFLMLVLVSSKNLIQLFLGWEGVGLCSYLLIGFWHHKNSAVLAADKAFIVNRVGDFGFLLGIMMFIYYSGSISIEPNSTLIGIKNELLLGSLTILDCICLLLLLGCISKSAQIGMHIWLPDAMEGPTPVSALIHAATMVTAGVFMIVRFDWLFIESQFASNLMIIIGSITCIFGALTAIGQNDIKKIIAYSTCSQLGYMFLGCGAKAYDAAMFHLCTHASFKAMLFLLAGNIIHAFGTQDITHMQGARKKMPFTYICFAIGTLAIMGIPPFAGYYSKDMIISSLYNSNSFYSSFGFYSSLIGAFLTGLYSIKLFAKVFYGELKNKQVHEIQNAINIPLTILLVGAIFSGYYGFHYVFKPLELHHVSIIWEIFPALIASAGGIFGFMISNSNNVPSILKNKFYFDEIYRTVLYKPFRCIATMFAAADKGVIDKLGPHLVVNLVKSSAKVFSLCYNGYIFNYTLLNMMGILSLIIWLTLQI
jgi:NADH-quinone oxidoreductase subunit L